jgi:hypothetical protein
MSEHEDQGRITDLRLVGRSEDGQNLELTDTVGAKYSIRIGDTLRATVNQPRLSSVAPIDDRPTISVKDIQARLRSGESMDSISRTTEWSLEKIEKFAGPILQERAYIIAQALKTPLKREVGANTLEETMWQTLGSHGVDLEQVEWNTHRRPDGQWTVVLHYPSRDGLNTAQWNFDATRGILLSEDDSAKWIGGEDRDPRQNRTAPTHGIVYNHENPPAPRLVAVKEEIPEERTVTLTSVERIEVIQEIDEIDEIDEIEETDEIEEIGDDELAEDIEQAKRDGVTSRPKIPSWDEIMFGSTPKDSE